MMAAPSPADATLPSADAADPSADSGPFWRRKRLDQMTPAEWESLCDGCGKCCLEKVQWGWTGAISHTDVACRLLDLDTCRCRRYAERRRWVANCEQLTARKIRRLRWLPATCAYRVLAEGGDLAWWHPLVSGDPETVHAAGISVRGRAVAPADAGPLEHHIVDWPR
jgi:uncharacterized cysteine cluster protein YcgN (CxxCxxCC family)